MKDWKKGKKYICLCRVYKTDNLGENAFYVHKLNFFILVSSNGENVGVFLCYLQWECGSSWSIQKKDGKKKNNLLGIPESFLARCCQKGQQDKEYLNHSNEVEKCLMPI